MPQEVNHSPHSAYVFNYHLIWILRYRKKVLVGPVEARLKELWAEGYYVGTDGHVSAETIKRYIEESQVLEY